MCLLSFEMLEAEPMTYQELNSKLIELKVPFPTTFTAVAVYESGWHFESGLANEANNIFGFVCITKTCYGGYSRWSTKIDCINFLYSWVQKNPPKQRECGIDFLRRRHYNPNESYYSVLQGIENKLEKEFTLD